MKKPALLLSLVVMAQLSLAQSKFIITDGSKNYDAEITVQSCESDTCNGQGTVVLMDKKTKKKFQTLQSEDLYFYLNEKQKPSVNIIQLYNEQSPLIFDDFNFDGSEDIAVRNGNQSSYGGPSYDVYVYNVSKKQFVPSDELTALAYENLGMFQTDHKRKRLITFAKSGCCWHITTEYAVIPKKGLQKVYELEEDATGADEYMKVITRKLVNNKWVIKTKKYKTDDYYKE
ncbi:XAC2610-related protein [Epilithonimonas arachidiradicis]|uniref:VCBS repeat protein n=1 Tax=Epilithonimonas arachidiradicis TaxID=1617282 RepID=A0A420CPR2_9FLAO|nr:hypothetical protein [Epilithonimonas arachidiradicis]RKE80410.1 hypothetical protein BXY58_2934 [Epilithonimonas arachidiradicis]GGG63917.1 hypothetical protein GCM10007332_27720 [Epilithonimonas arachidiradicis]